MWREIESGTIIRENQSWVDRNGIRHPKNWQIWTEEYKAEMGLEEFQPDPAPNTLTWEWTRDEAGKVTKTARDVDSVKQTLLSKIKDQQREELLKTDWAVTRKSEKGTEIPEAIQNWRDEIRVAGNEKETSIANAADTESIEAILGTLFDWPELEA